MVSSSAILDGQIGLYVQSIYLLTPNLFYTRYEKFHHTSIRKALPLYLAEGLGNNH